MTRISVSTSEGSALIRLMRAAPRGLDPNLRSSSDERRPPRRDDLEGAQRFGVGECQQLARLADQTRLQRGQQFRRCNQNGVLVHRAVRRSARPAAATSAP